MAVSAPGRWKIQKRGRMTVECHVWTCMDVYERDWSLLAVNVLLGYPFVFCFVGSEGARKEVQRQKEAERWRN